MPSEKSKTFSGPCSALRRAPSSNILRIHEERSRELCTASATMEVMGGEGVTVLAVNIGEDSDTVFAFLGTVEPSPSFPLLFDQDGASLDAWGVKGLPLCTLRPLESVVDVRSRIWRSANRRYVDADHQHDGALLLRPDLLQLMKVDACRFCKVDHHCEGVASSSGIHLIDEDREERWIIRRGRAGIRFPVRGRRRQPSNG